MSAIGAVIELTRRNLLTEREKVAVTQAVSRVLRFILMVTGFVLLCLAAFNVSTTAGLAASGLACLILEWLLSSGKE